MIRFLHGFHMQNKNENKNNSPTNIPSKASVTALSFKFRFLGSGQKVSNQNLLLVTDRNSGTHNQNQNISLI